MDVQRRINAYAISIEVLVHHRCRTLVNGPVLLYPKAVSIEDEKIINGNQYWLGRVVRQDNDEIIWKAAFLDGPHFDIDSARKAYAIIKEYQLDYGLNRQYLIISIERLD